MKIAIAVQGRFHAFALAKALLELGHDVTVFTNYPKWATSRFGLDPKSVRSYWPQGVLARLVERVPWLIGPERRDRMLLQMFGRWLASHLVTESWDVVHLWSGAAEEFLAHPDRLRTCRLATLMRGSAHIETQAQLLTEEGARTGVAIEGPNPWIRVREEREYRKADLIVTLSTFAYESFRERPELREKVRRIPLGVNTKAFEATPEAVATRQKRIASGSPLRLLYVGSVSVQKGIYDLIQTLRRLPPDRFELTMVGAVLPEMSTLLGTLDSNATLAGKRPETELPDWYVKHDLFIFPSIQDGFAAVLAQAACARLPILTTTNCGGPDLVKDGVTGWVLPIRSPEAFSERLLWCDQHREELAAMCERIPSHGTRTWLDTATDFVAICQDAIQKERQLAAHQH